MKNRKEYPVFTGLLQYFPDACLEVAHVSFVANEQHNPGQPMHWAREKSIGKGDELVRHLMDKETYDTDGLRHRAKAAWRALELLQRELESGIINNHDGKKLLSNSAGVGKRQRSHPGGAHTRTKAH